MTFFILLHLLHPKGPGSRLLQFGLSAEHRRTGEEARTPFDRPVASDVFTESDGEKPHSGRVRPAAPLFLLH